MKAPVLAKHCHRAVRRSPGGSITRLIAWTQLLPVLPRLGGACWLWECCLDGATPSCEGRMSLCHCSCGAWESGGNTEAFTYGTTEHLGWERTLKISLF